MEWGFPGVGLLVGLLVGVSGVGGGALMTPLLVLLFGVAPVVAIGTDLLYAAITKSAGVVIHQRQQSVCWRLVGLLALGSIPATLLTLLLLQPLMASRDIATPLLLPLLGVLLLLTGLLLLLRERLRGWFRSGTLGPAMRRWLMRWQWPLTPVAGALLGCLVTLSSVGAGAIGAALLLLLHPRLTPVRLVGTDIAHAVPLTAIAGLGHLQLGHVDLSMLLLLLSGSLPGIWIGSRLALRLPAERLRRLLALLLLLLGGRLLMV